MSADEPTPGGYPTPQPISTWVPQIDRRFDGDPLVTRPEGFVPVRSTPARAHIPPELRKGPSPAAWGAPPPAPPRRPPFQSPRPAGAPPPSVPVAPRRPQSPPGTGTPGRTGFAPGRQDVPVAPRSAPPPTGSRPRVATAPPPPQRRRKRHTGDGKRDLPRMDPAALRVTVLIPAHNEVKQITETIASLRGQMRPPDHIVVIADNCTDKTAALAHLLGAEIVETRDNPHKKAGALNQVLDRLLDVCDDHDVIMVMDADSSLDAGFIHYGVEYLASGDYAAIGGTFTGKPGGGLVGMFQRNEYARYARDVRRLDGQALVLTGTATLFRAGVLHEVVETRRKGDLPGKPTVYDVRVLTEDNELTLAILHMGFRILCPPECTLTTEVMLTWGDLFRQRLRWKRGALENLVDYGWTPVTRPYWGRQALSLIGIIVIMTYLVTLAYAVAVGEFHLHPLWLGVTVVFMVERVVSVRQRGPVQMAIAATIWIEMVFDVFLQVAQAKAFWEAALSKERKW
ncbi:glycosyltransferase family 2 protein [Actinocorallia sp. API 0066]|uniref:glycosyltransferase n=1 Tax=Actinocorallia sp. API 0066 TaxID=2896846 RepID=UPI001E642225|nr:glycosyltransferase family 2 protein [Actinocorallia sp. API 0066]MCD0452715.1 glycosyltransferase family 2 protein [Actinocorallia sp. API 0066]